MFQLEFEAIASVAQVGHIALDDISLDLGHICPAYSQGVCDFQSGYLCRWINPDGNWAIGNNGTGNPGSGPK